MNHPLCTLCAFIGLQVSATHVGYSNTKRAYFLCDVHALYPSANLDNIRRLKDGEEWHNKLKPVTPDTWYTEEEKKHRRY